VLERYIKDRLAQRDLLLMTHIVLGHPDFDTSLRLIETMVRAGVDLMELLRTDRRRAGHSAREPGGAELWGDGRTLLRVGVPGDAAL